MLTLNDCKMLRYEDFFLAIIKRSLNWEDAENTFLTLPDFSEPITAIDLLRIAVDETLIENNEQLTDENRKKIEDAVKHAITPHLEEWYPVILVKYEDGYLDLSQMQMLEVSYEIVYQIPFSKYYKESDYSFEEDENGPYLNIDMKPFELFTKEYENRRRTS